MTDDVKREDLVAGDELSDEALDEAGDGRLCATIRALPCFCQREAE